MPIAVCSSGEDLIMPTRNVVLTERQENLIDALVQSGRYQNASEVLREGLRLVEDHEVAAATKLEALRAAVHVGVADFGRGAFKTFADSSALIAHFEKVGEAVIAGVEGG
jgi:antitoxin ParD1/3/4